ncbi:hypothetical protein [Salinimicrobium xinjiangense]|uniref:hypothetical protein n=1 Tax=Salinimicrobium xinjiangense TaxID=438596 RepID=UPI00042687D3|nr:hypothetical protein [Salinimicrobium xinjiangense]
MEKLIILNNQVNALLGVDIHCNLAINNFKINGYWVTEVNHFHFAQFKKKFKKLIDNNINRDSEREVIFLKNLQDDLNKNLSFLKEINYEKIKDFCSSVDLNFPEKPPVYNPRDLAEVTPWDNEGRAEFIFQFLLTYLKEDVGHEELGEKEWDEIDKLLEEKGLVVDELYGKAHLMIIVSYQLNLIQEVIDYIQSYFNTLEKMGINYWDKEEDNDFSKYPQQLHFNMLKKEVAMFFHTFHQLGLIHGDINKRKISETEMNKFLSSGPFYYINVRKELKPLTKLSKEFGGLYRGEAANKISDEELNFVQHLIKRLQERKELLENEKKEYLKRRK